MIVRPLRYIWVGFFTTIALLALLSLGVGLVGGHIAAFVTLIVGLLLAGGWRQYQLRRLVAWTREPMGAALPEAPGVWGEIFTEFDRRARLTYELRDRQAAALQRFQDASHAMPDGVLILSQEDAIEWLNLKAEKHFGLDRRRDVGAPLGNLVRDPEFVAYLQRQHREEPLLMRSGRGGGLSLQVQIIPFGDNQKLVLSSDISQIEKLETMRRDFVANVSHELKTPLSSIKAFAETLRLGAIDDRGVNRKFLGQIETQTQLLEQQILDLLHLARVESGRTTFEMSAVDLNLAARECIERFRTEAVQRGLRHGIIEI